MTNINKASQKSEKSDRVRSIKPFVNVIFKERGGSSDLRRLLAQLLSLLGLKPIQSVGTEATNSNIVGLYDDSPCTFFPNGCTVQSDGFRLPLDFLFFERLRCRPRQSSPDVVGFSLGIPSELDASESEFESLDELFELVSGDQKCISNSSCGPDNGRGRF